MSLSLDTFEKVEFPLSLMQIGNTVNDTIDKLKETKYSKVLSPSLFHPLSSSTQNKLINGIQYLIEVYNLYMLYHTCCIISATLELIYGNGLSVYAVNWELIKVTGYKLFH